MAEWGAAPSYGRFRVRHGLAAGGYGQVYVAIDDATGQRAAIKVLIGPTADIDPVAFQRFEREIEVMGRITHEGVPRLLDHDLTARPPWFATEYVGGLSLYQLGSRCGAFPDEAVAHLGAGLGDVLAAIHTDTVHRDLKAGNVLLTRQRPLIIDFGLSRRDGQPGMTVLNARPLSPDYAAPERIADERTIDDRRADVFELGATLVFALTAEAPHRIADATRRQTVDLSAVGPRLRPLLESALAPNPAHRPTAAEFASRARALCSVPTFTEAMPVAVLDQLDQQDRDSAELSEMLRDPGPAIPEPRLRSTVIPGGTFHRRSTTLRGPRDTRVADDVRVDVAGTGDGVAQVAATSDGGFAVRARDGEIHGVSSDGRRWRRRVGARGLVAVDDVLFAGANDGFVHVLDPQRGSTVERLWVGGPVTGTAGVGSWVLAGGSSGVLCAFSARGQGLVGEWPLGAPLDGDPVGTGSLAIASALDGTVHAVDLRAGSTRWTRSLGDRALALGAGEELVLAATVAGEVVALDPTDGTTRWRARTSAPAAGAVVSATGDACAVVTVSGLVSVFSGDGEVLVERALPAAVRRSVTRRDGQVLVGTLDGTLHAIALDGVAPTVLVDRADAPLEAPVAVEGERIVVARSDGTVRTVSSPRVAEVRPVRTGARAAGSDRDEVTRPVEPTRLVATSGARCPLCRWPLVDGTCPDCTLQGASSPERQRAHDLDALARSASGRPDLSAVHAWCRHATTADPDVLDAEIDQARTRVATEQDALVARGRSSGGPEESVARLVGGEIERIVLVELGPDSASAHTLVPGPGGVPQAGPVVGPVPYMAAASAVERDVQRYRLAGGVRVDDPEPDAAAPGRVVETLDLAIELSTRRVETDIVLVRRVVGWRHADRVARALRSLVLPRADVVRTARHGELEGMIRDLCDGAPLRRAHHLVVAHLGPDGAVWPVGLPLFPAGTSPFSARASTSVRLRRPPGPEGTVYLPVARAGEEAPVAWPLVSLARCELAAGDTEVRARLASPGQVELEVVDPRGSARPATPAALDEDPRHALPVVHTPVDPVDVLIAVELSGEEKVVRSRLALVEAVGAVLERRVVHLPGRVRLGLVGFGDHVDGARQWSEEIQIVPFGSPARTAAHAIRWTAHDVQHTHGSALDDALRYAAGARWASGAARRLLVIGSRPPAIVEQLDERGVVCRHRTNWAAELMRLKSAGTGCVAVVDEPAFVGEPNDPTAPRRLTRWVWQELGSAGRLDLDTCDVAALIACVAPGPETPSGSLPLALAAPAPAVRTRQATLIEHPATTTEGAR